MNWENADEHIWWFPKMGNPQVTTGVQYQKGLILDDLGVPPISGNLHVKLVNYHHLDPRAASSEQSRLSSSTSRLWHLPRSFQDNQDPDASPSWPSCQSLLSGNGCFNCIRLIYMEILWLLSQIYGLYNHKYETLKVTIVTPKLPSWTWITPEALSLQMLRI